MATHEWTLYSPELAHDCRETSLNAGDVPGTPAGWRVSLRMLAKGLSQGVELVEIDNGKLRFVVVPTRGMGLWRAWMENRELGWRSPVHGPVHPSYVPIAEPSGLGWLSGFDELMCRCGLESNGAPDFDERGQLIYPLHGRIANQPARELRLTIDDVAGTISLHGVVEESRFHFQKLRLHTVYTTNFGGSRVHWRDEVENFGGTTASMQMLYHTNIGEPQLDGGSRFVAAITDVWPGNSDTVALGIEDWDLFSAPHASFQQQVYQCRMIPDDDNNTRVLLRNSTGMSGIQLTYNVQQLPCFSLWRNLVASEDGYVTGIEPATNYPNPRSWETMHKRVVFLKPMVRWTAELALEWFLDPKAVAESERAIQELQGGRQVAVHADILDK